MLCTVPSEALGLEPRLSKRQKSGESHTAGVKLPAQRCSSSSSASRFQISLEDASSVDSSSSCEEPSWEFESILSFTSGSSCSSDVISAIDYDESRQLVATGGLARKIRICSYRELVQGDPVPLKSLFSTICMPAKLSSLKWRPGSSEEIACGDYDGSVTEWDVEHGATVSERYEHSGRIVWSVDYSSAGILLASASSDRSVRFWSRSSERSVGMISAPRRNSMCCVEFSKSPGSFHVAVASADACAYVYDLRKLESAMVELRGHQRSVSYVRWLGESELVSSSPDGTVKLWDISSGEKLLRSFCVHSNERNFVGLSVVSVSGRGGGSGLIATGSESNEVFVYGSSRERPVFRHRFEEGDGDDHHHLQQQRRDEKAFVGSVCWTKQEDHFALISANSQGIVQVIRASET